MEKHKQTELAIEENIRSGRWKLHEKLPAERDLAVSLGVSRNTLRTALQVLHGKGILGSRRGSGTFVQEIPGQKNLYTRQNFRDRLLALAILFPPIVPVCARAILQSEFMDLEIKLSHVGLAVQIHSTTDLAKAQSAFLLAVAERTHNPQLAVAIGQVVPRCRFFSEALAPVSRTDSEMLFASLAGLLGSMRRQEPDLGQEHAEAYTKFLMKVCKVDVEQA